eukprot:TRINITY_DN9722_c0_g2_i1.p1 TRINITY_DN9722_c0_g2~~TRINITY_DN9722_c0_g2_i1.p1  ORF type:complete len:339 (-),score=77.64 TRINITY_DN9722_c0_g2_i1:793-1809(-)
MANNFNTQFNSGQDSSDNQDSEFKEIGASSTPTAAATSNDAMDVDSVLMMPRTHRNSAAIISGLRDLFGLSPELPVLSVLSVVSNQLDALRPSPSAFQFYRSKKQYLDFKAIFDNNPVAMAVCSLNGSFITCNEKWSSLTGLGADIISKYTIVSIAHPRTVLQLYEALQFFAEGKSDTWSGVQHCVHPVGFQFSAQLEMSRIEMPEGDEIFADSYSAVQANLGDINAGIISSSSRSTTHSNPDTSGLQGLAEASEAVSASLPISRTSSVSISRKSSMDMSSGSTPQATAGVPLMQIPTYVQSSSNAADNTRFGAVGTSSSTNKTRSVILCTIVSVAAL